MIIDKSFVAKSLPKLPDDINKYTAGYVLSFAGSYGMSGAAVLMARAAYKSGAGLVRIVLPKSIYPICAASICEAVYTPVDETTDGKITADTYAYAKDCINKCGAVVFGCGMGMGEGVKATLDKLLTDNAKPLLIDADGINILSQHIDILRDKACKVVLTPHEGEMSRLTGKSIQYIKANREAVALEFAKEYGVTLLLKGKNTVIASELGELLINPTGNAGLATAGSGDVLSGIIGALMSQGIDPFNSAAVGAYIHGLSGDLAAADLGQRSVTATDITEYLHKAFKEC